MANPILDGLRISKYMGDTHIVETFNSHYCKIAFLFFLVVSYFLIPDYVFYTAYFWIAILFMLTMSVTLTCIVRNIKEKVKLARSSGKSFISVVAIALGLAALQVCGIGSPACGASIGLGILSALFPGIFMGTIAEYSIYIIGISVLLQLLSLFSMNCFKKTLKLNQSGAK